MFGISLSIVLSNISRFIDSIINKREIRQNENQKKLVGTVEKILGFN